MSYTTPYIHEQARRDLAECRSLDDMIYDEADLNLVKDCYLLQKKIIELAESYGCEITNKKEVLDDMKARVENYEDYIG